MLLFEEDVIHDDQEVYFLKREDKIVIDISHDTERENDDIERNVPYNELVLLENPKHNNVYDNDERMEKEDHYYYPNEYQTITFHRKEDVDMCKQQTHHHQFVQKYLEEQSEYIFHLHNDKAIHHDDN